MPKAVSYTHLDVYKRQSLTLLDPKESAQMSARNDILASLVKTEKGHISNCLANFVRTLQEDPVLKGAICLNLLTERVDMLGDLGWPRSDSSAITDTDLHYLCLLYTSRCV